MPQDSIEPVINGKMILNDGFGNRCTIPGCGGFFDEGGFCNNQHEKDKVYFIPLDSDEEKE